MPTWVNASGTAPAVRSSQFHASTAIRSAAVAAGWSDVLAAGEPRRSNGARTLEELMLRPAGDHLAAVEHQQIAAEAEGFFHVVRYKDHHAVVVGQRLAKLLFHLPPQMRIERRKGLIEEQRVRLDGHASRNGHALPLPAGDLCRIAIGQFGNVHPFKLPLDARLPLALRQCAQPKADILRHRHVRKQGVVLKDDADLPLRGGDIAAWSRCRKRTRPLRTMRPRSGATMPAIMRSVMDLPAPEAPSNPTAPRPAQKPGTQIEVFQRLFDVNLKRGGGRGLVRSARKRRLAEQGSGEERAVLTGLPCASSSPSEAGE